MSTTKHKYPDSDDDDDVIILSPPKKGRMEASNRNNVAPVIRIEQVLKHDVWDLRRKDDGVFVMKKLNENGADASSQSTGAGRNVGNGVNAKQSGKGPLTPFQFLKDTFFPSNAVNTQKNEVHAPQVGKDNIPNPVSAPKHERVSINMTAPPKEVITMGTVHASKTSVITICPSPAPKKEVITINVPAPKKEVITMKTVTSPKLGVITINTSKPSNGKEAASTQNQCFMDLVQQAKQDIQSEEVKGVAGRNVDQSSSSKPYSENQSVRGAQSEIGAIYTEEALQVQDMFPEVPLHMIVDDLICTESMQTTIENILDGKLVPPVLPVSHNSQGDLLRPSNSTTSSGGCPVVHQSDNEVISQQSVKTENKVQDTKKAGGTLIKIELIAQNEIWDIKKKAKEGYVMQKVIPNDDSHHKGSKRVKVTPCADHFAEPTEEESKDLATDMLIDDMPYKGNPDEVNVPVKLMIYTKSSKASAGEEKVESTVEIDGFHNDHSGPEEKVSLDSFDFSDDENEEGETVEHFLFKACLALKELKYKIEAGNKELSDSALLKITGQVRKEENDSSVADKGSDEEYYTDECHTDDSADGCHIDETADECHIDETADECHIDETADECHIDETTDECHIDNSADENKD